MVLQPVPPLQSGIILHEDALNSIVSGFSTFSLSTRAKTH
jgi:hypothetical protein